MYVPRQVSFNFPCSADEIFHDFQEVLITCTFRHSAALGQPKKEKGNDLDSLHQKGRHCSC